MTTNHSLTTTQIRWLRYAAKEHRALQAREEFAPQEIPSRTRDALVKRGLMARHELRGMGGAIVWYRITQAGLDKAAAL